MIVVPDNSNHDLLRNGVLLAALFFCVIVSLAMGRYALSPADVFSILIDHMASLLFGVPVPDSGTAGSVVFDVRIPRIIAAILVGAGLSVSGASFQGIFRNPLVSPYILGVSTGAGFGASLAILLFDNSFVVQVSAFAFGIFAVLLTWGLSRMYRMPSVTVLVLAGIIVGSLFSALVSLVKYLADPYEKLPQIVFWLMGSFATVRLPDLVVAGPLIIGCSLVLIVVRWQINALSLGDDEAKALGVDTRVMKVVIIGAATMIAASAVSIAGIIGWVGLVVPHIARMLVGPDHRKVLPTSFFIGGMYLLLVDDVARTLTAAEIPIGILTAVVGAPFFAYVLSRQEVGWS